MPAILHKGIIAIVDDDDSIRGAMQKLLRFHGYLVYTFASAEEFLRAAVRKDIQCLVSDIKMPGMGGLELQRQLIGSGQKTPTIFMTAYPEDKVRARASSAGAAGFLSKPFDSAVLMGLIEHALSDCDSQTDV